MQSFRNASGTLVLLLMLGLGYLAYRGWLVPLVLGVLVVAWLYQRGKSRRARRETDNPRVPE
jgi:4-hydroxybenzoate polyprenyltransferase